MMTALSSAPEKKPAAAKPKPKPAAKKAASESQIVFDTSSDRAAVAEQAISDKKILGALVDNLSTDARRVRQFSAAAINSIAEQQPEVLVSYIPQIADALHRPEAQTRWEVLEALSRLVELNPEAADDALSGAEVSLYDEESGSARLAAVRFLSAYGALDNRRSARVWPLLDEAIQCYHGDPEFQDMLVAITGFAGGRLKKEVRVSLASRMEFDAKNSKGSLKRRAGQIVELCSRKK
jgi:hypothetical protein